MTTTTPDNSLPAKGKPKFMILGAKLLAEGVKLPPPIERAVDHETLPLAVGFHDQMMMFCERHGYTAEQTATLRRCVSHLVSSNGYLIALAADHALRVDIDGDAVEPVTEVHALVAALQIHARALAKGGAKELEPPPRDVTTAQAAAITANRLKPTLRLPVKPVQRAKA